MKHEHCRDIPKVIFFVCLGVRKYCFNSQIQRCCIVHEPGSYKLSLSTANPPRITSSDDEMWLSMGEAVDAMIIFRNYCDLTWILASKDVIMPKLLVWAVKEVAKVWAIA